MSTELSTAAIEECLFAPFTTARDEFDALLAEIAALRNDLKREVYEAKFLELQAENAALRTLISEMRLTFDAHKEREVALENKNAALREQLESAEQRMSEMIHKTEHELQMETEARRGWDICIKRKLKNFPDGYRYETYAEAVKSANEFIAQKAKE